MRLRKGKKMFRLSLTTLGCGAFMLLSSLTLSAGTSDSTGNNNLAGDLGPTKRENFKKCYRQVDSVIAIIQYLAQVFNKGSITVANKKQAMAWIEDTLEQTKQLNDFNEDSIDNLNKILRTTKALCAHLSGIIHNDFQEWTPFEIPLLRSVSDEELEEFDFKELFDANEILIKELRNDANNAGLTAINKLARKLDKWNDKYHVTDIISKVPTIGCLAFFGILLAPGSWFDKNTFLRELKDKIGPEKKEKNDWKTISGFLDSHTMKGLKNLATLLLAARAADSIIFENLGISDLRTKFRNVWSGLKGMEVAEDLGYEYPTITLDDPRLIGLEDQIKQARNIVNYIANPEAYDRSNSNLQKGILLEGTSRCGKTLLAKAVAGSINELQRAKGDAKRFKFITLKLDEIRFTPDGIKTIIKAAAENAPCIYFIDEIHNLALQVKENQQGDALTQFLTMAEALLGQSVIVMAATNRSYMIDEALLKYDRFGLRIRFEEPSYENRKKFFEVYFKENAIDSTEFDVESLARQTYHASYGDLMSIFKNGRFTALHEGRRVSQQDFQEAIYREIYRLQIGKKSPLSSQEKAVIAAHQAGHALMYMLYESEIQEVPECVTLHGKWKKIVETKWFEAKEVREEHAKKKTKYGHMIVSPKSEILKIATPAELECKIKLAGHIAEKILLGKASYHYHPKDKRKALTKLEEIAFEGLKKEDYTKEEQRQRCQKALSELSRCEKETYDILTQHKALLEKIARALEQKELLTAAELRELGAEALKLPAKPTGSAQAHGMLSSHVAAAAA